MASIGLAVARHALVAIAVAVSIGVYLSLLMLLRLWTTSLDRLTGASHAWTTLQLLASSDSSVPDISIKQVWVYGGGIESGALEQETVREAMRIQETLLGSESGDAIVTRRMDTGRWTSANAFVHSLLPDSNRLSALGSSESIVEVIRDRIGKISSANITLDPASVLMGSVWSDGRLGSADALIISLFYMNNSGAGTVWDEHAEVLAHAADDHWMIFFHNDTTPPSILYRFVSRPLSTGDEVTFFAAYSLVAVLVTREMKNLKPVRTKGGLLVAMILQVRIPSHDYVDL